MECLGELLLGDYDRCARPEGVAHPQLVGGVDVRGREIRDNEVRVEKLLVHRRIDRARVLELIRTDNPHEAAGLTASQFVSLGMFLAGILALMVLYRFMPERSKYAVPFVPPPSEKDAND